MRTRARRILASCALLFVLGTASGCGGQGDGGQTWCVYPQAALICV